MGREGMNEVKKLCADCNTTKTPLWRSGPHGPRSLCNACGIRYRKRKMANEKPSSEIKREKPSSSSGGSSTIDYDGDFGDQMNMKESFKMGFSDLSKQMIVQASSSSSSSSQLKRQRSNSTKRKMEEVEQAAALLMSLSCGSVLA